MNRWIAPKALATDRPTSTNNAPATGESVAISTPSDHATEVIPMKVRCAFCQYTHNGAQNRSAKIDAALSTNRLRRRMTSRWEASADGNSRCPHQDRKSTRLNSSHVK